ncbi:MAG: 3TM-type holin [Pseudomonadota bacterium]
MWPQLLALIPSVLDKLIPDPQAAADAKLKLVELMQKGELAQLDAQVQLAQGQNETNKIEAANARLFVAGWRPFVGWICACAFGFKFIGGPLLVMVGAYCGLSIALPQIDSTELLPLMLGMLGLGGLRTIEKVKGAA